MGYSHDRPPVDWPGLEMASITRLTDDIYFGWLEHEANPMFWHWCAALAGVPEDRLMAARWLAAGTQDHTLVSREPLHLEPSLLWRCCGTHGWVRDGAWTPA